MRVFVLFANFLGLVVLMKKKKNRDLPGGSVVNTLHFHGRGHRFSPSSGHLISSCCAVQPKFLKKKKKKKRKLFTSSELHQFYL